MGLFMKFFLKMTYKKKNFFTKILFNNILNYLTARQLVKNYRKKTQFLKFESQKVFKTNK